MGTKVIKTTSEQTIYVCDRCDKQIDARRSCKICQREVGYCCSQLAQVYDSGQQESLDLRFYVCKDCDEAGRDVHGRPYIDLIRDKVKEADACVLSWRARAKLRRDKGDAT